MRRRQICSRLESAFQAACLQTGLPRVVRKRRACDDKANHIAVDSQRCRSIERRAAFISERLQLRRCGSAIAVAVNLRFRLRGWNLRSINDDIVDDAIGGEREAIEMVNAEVAEGVGGDGCGTESHETNRDQPNERKAMAGGAHGETSSVLS